MGGRSARVQSADVELVVRSDIPSARHFARNGILVCYPWMEVSPPVCVLLLATCLGHTSSLVGLAVMIVLIPVPAWCAKLMDGTMTKKMKAVRKFCSRIITSNILTSLSPDGRTCWDYHRKCVLKSPRIFLLGPADVPVIAAMNIIRMIKLFGWESQLKQKIAVKREGELAMIWREKWLEAVLGVVK